MTDDGLDSGLARDLWDYSRGGIRPIDAMAIAQAAVGRGWRRWFGLDVTSNLRSSSDAAGYESANVILEDGLVPTGTGAGRWQRWPALGSARRRVALRLAIAATAVVVIAVAGASLLPSLGGVVGTPTTTAEPSPAATVGPSVPPTPAAEYPDAADLTHSVTVDGLPFSFRLPPPGVSGAWETFGSLLVSKSVAGPQGAEAMVFWAGFPHGTYADPCINAPIGQWTAEDVAAGVAAAPGTELVMAPEDVTVGGYPAKHVVVVVREDTGCDPGFFYNWKAQTGGASWVRVEQGDTIRVWVVDVNGTLVFIEGETRRDLAPGVALTDGGRARLEQEIQQIVDSIQFE